MSDDKIDKLIEQNKEILEELKSLRKENKELREENKKLKEYIEKMQERQERLESKLNKNDIEDLVATLYLQNRTKKEIKEKLSNIDKRATDKYFESSYQKISNDPDYQKGREPQLADLKERAKERNMPLNEYKDMSFIGTLYRLNHKKRVEAGLEPDTEIEQGDYDALEDWYEDYIENDDDEENED
jgi:DNA repair exonuclease SbcCD ATPase subunit